jgi:hypothetical protein
MEEQVFPAVVEDPVIVHLHRPSQECNSGCYAIPAGDLQGVLRPSTLDRRS